jgi:tRNA pseudouridine38-40 synthase
MPRYFLELAYMGTRYAGFQVQQNANTVQAEVEKALAIYLRKTIELTGSSRTDAGVHARQNFFHFDVEGFEEGNWPDRVYHLNAILPKDIVIKQIFAVKEDAHCRFDALSRTYEYTLYHYKDPFLRDRAYYYPFKLEPGLLNEAAYLIKATTGFKAFAKRNSQVQTFDCTIHESEWICNGQVILYRVKGNRFLRGMVRGLVGTMLRVGSKKAGMEEFRGIIASQDPSKADFSVPAHGLALVAVQFPF